MKYINHIKSGFRYFITAILWTFLFLMICYLIPTKWYYNTNKNCKFDIYVAQEGIHTNIIVPVKTEVFDWNNHISLETIGTDKISDYQYLSFGWGERDFFIQTRTPADFKLSSALKALFFLNNPSTLYVQGYRTLPKDKTILRKCVKVEPKSYLNLVKFINSTFALDAQGNKKRIANGYYDYGGFYAAKRTYSIFRNCNSWTAEGLRLADVNTPLWPGLPSAIMFHLRSDCNC